MAFRIKVNGVDRTADVDGDTPLLWVLRDVFGMSGTKFGCESRELRRSFQRSRTRSLRRVASVYGSCQSIPRR